MIQSEVLSSVFPTDSFSEVQLFLNFAGKQNVKHHSQWSFSGTPYSPCAPDKMELHIEFPPWCRGVFPHFIKKCHILHITSLYPTKIWPLSQCISTQQSKFLSTQDINASEKKNEKKKNVLLSMWVSGLWVMFCHLQALSRIIKGTKKGPVAGYLVVFFLHLDQSCDLQLQMLHHSLMFLHSQGCKVDWSEHFMEGNKISHRSMVSN